MAHALLHADQRFTHHRPIVAGARLVAEQHVDGVRAMGGGAMITTRSEIFALGNSDSADSREPVATNAASHSASIAAGSAVCENIWTPRPNRL